MCMLAKKQILHIKSHCSDAEQKLLCTKRNVFMYDCIIIPLAFQQILLLFWLCLLRYAHSRAYPDLWLLSPDNNIRNFRTAVITKGE